MKSEYILAVIVLLGVLLLAVYLQPQKGEIVVDQTWVWTEPGAEAWKTQFTEECEALYSQYDNPNYECVGAYIGVSNDGVNQYTTPCTWHLTNYNPTIGYQRFESGLRCTRV